MRCGRRVGLQRLVYVLVVIEGGEHQHTSVHPSAAEEPTGRLDAVEPRHPDVHEDDVGIQSDRLVERLDAIGGRRLHVVHLGVARLVVNELVAGRAVPAGLDGGAAGGVTRGVRQVGVPGPPVREQAERPG
jgi:hypothetical protein